MFKSKQVDSNTGKIHKPQTTSNNVNKKEFFLFEWLSTEFDQTEKHLVRKSVLVLQNDLVTRLIFDHALRS